MEEKNKHFSLKRTLITIFFVLLTAGVVGGSVWYIMDSNMKEEKIATDKLIQEIQEKTDDSPYCIIARKSKDLSLDYNCSTSREFKEGEVTVVRVSMERPNMPFIDRILFTINTETKEIMSVAIAN